MANSSVPTTLVDLLRAAWTRLHTNTGAGRDAFPLAARRVIDAAQLQAQVAESRLRAAIQAMPEGVVFLDEEGRYILWNDKYAEIYHRSADLFAPGRKLSETLRIGVARGDYPDAVGCEEAWIAERLAQMENLTGRHEQRLADGRWIMIEERKTADGGAIGIRVDITDMKQAATDLRRALAQAENANRAKSEFLANMSHEIRTPLNGVVGMAHVLAGTPLTATQTRLVKTIVDSAGDLEQMLSDVLDLTRIEAGRLDIRAEPFDVAQMIELAAEPHRRAALDKGLAFDVHIDADVPRRLIGDCGRLGQVISNLLSNAVKFTAQGGVSLRVFCDDASQRWVFQVSDSGIGFEPSMADQLFDRFVQGDGSMTRQYGGSGLGLAICRELVEMMDGRATASGAPGHGATFRIEVALPPALSATAPMRLAGAA